MKSHYNKIIKNSDGESGGKSMKFFTHDFTPKRTDKKEWRYVNVLWGMFFCLLLFISLMCSYYSKSFLPALIILMPFTLIFISLRVIVNDFEKSFVEIDCNEIHVVDYPFGKKKERRFQLHDIGSCEVLSGYSTRIRGNRNNRISYIVCFSKNNEYLFKVMYQDDTKEYIETLRKKWF